MSSVTYSTSGSPTRDELIALYDSVGWTVYTADPARLEDAVAGSTFVVTARIDGDLVGLARAVSDDATIVYVQDILVVPDAQRQGIGKQLLATVIERFAHVRQKVLLTDDEERQHALYRSLGFADTAEVERLHAFVRFDDPKSGD